MDRIVDNNIVKEVKQSFLNYAMSVIKSRALPDLRDGMKPVHRRIIFSMYKSGYTPDKPTRKSARIVGDVIGKYHPHGDSSIYDAMVRMAQTFSYRYVLVDGQGNFGTLDGDGAAAMRYTEARLSKLSLEMVRDINKNTVDFEKNFDETEEEPTVLPSRFPNILVNGSMGIAVGMATNIPPHNLGEVIDGCVAYIENHEITSFELMNYIKGPDFPTGGIILGSSGIKKAYETGKGTVTIRGRANIEEINGKNRIVITELPYQLNKAEFVTKLGELIRDKIIDGIVDIHDESNLENPVRVVVYLRRDANANVILNNIYKYTQLQTTYSINLLMLDQKKPSVLSLRDIISKYIDYQREIIIRRTKYDLKQAQDKVHILEGLKIALDHLDEVIKLIRNSKSDTEAKEGLISKFGLDEIQANAILEMKLRRLTGLEREKIENDLAELLKAIDEFKAILASDEKVLEIIKNELIEIKNKYSDERRTEINNTMVEYIEDESLIPNESSIITLTNKGYIKRMSVDTYKTQNRGGTGVKGMSTNEEDFVEQMLSTNTHDYILFFTNKGKVYRLKGYEIPEFSRQAKGLPIINLLQIEKDEMVNSIIKLSKEDENKFLVLVTKSGLIKRTNVEEFERIRQNGKICITLKDDDELIGVRLSDGNNSIALGSSDGRMVIFDENDIRCMGRTASGVRGINLIGDNKCIGLEVTKPEKNILIVTEKGYGKKTKVSEYRTTKRGSKGVKALSITDKNGSIASFRIVDDSKDVMIITDSGMMIRIGTEQISQLGRVTQGVKLINLKDNQKVSTISIIDKSADNEEISEENNDNTTNNIEEVA